ncbi:flavin reductase family protein [Roseomonas sp. AR75]|uniref:flavin reductase family protein n=1 Tax=Roseomonas sp. AR75 TaxID=2562311 RepID=UPI0010C05163|nr:flavin reductase family protein [Roseomonas sp. AR75]
MIFDMEALPPKERYKLLTATVVPRPIAWVVTLDAAGVVNAAPFSFFNVLSQDPPVVGVSIEPPHGGGVKDTAANIAATGAFTVCLVSSANAAAMNVTAIPFAPGVDELAAAGLTAAPSSRIAPPRIAESPVALECTLFQTIPIGGHRLVLGRCLAMHVRDDCVLDAERHYIDTARLDLIGRTHTPGGYVRMTGSFDLPRITEEEWRQRG